MHSSTKHDKIRLSGNPLKTEPQRKRSCALKRFGIGVRITVYLLLVAVAAFFFVACEESDLPPAYVPSEITQTEPSQSEGDSLSTDETQSEDSSQTGDLTQGEQEASLPEEEKPSQEEQGTQEETREDASEPQEGSSVDTQNEPEQGSETEPTEETPSDEHPTEDTPTEGGDSVPNDPDPTEPDLGQETTDYSLIFDLSQKADDLYRYRTTAEVAGVYSLYARMQNAGSVTVRSDGTLLFTDHNGKVCELWGAWDEEGNLSCFLRFENGAFYEAVIRHFSTGDYLQIDLSCEQLLLLLGEAQEEPSQGETPSSDPDPQEPQGEEQKEDPQSGSEEQNGEEENAVGEQNGEEEQNDPAEQNADPDENDQNGNDPEENDQNPPDPNEENPGEEKGEGEDQGSEQPADPAEDPPASDDPQEDPAQDPLEEEGDTAASLLPRESDAYSFLSDLKGRAQSLTVHAMTDEAEDYSFVLELSDRDYLFLLQKIEPIETFHSETALGEDFRAQKFLGAKYFTFVLQITETESGERANIKVTGYSD